MNTKNQQKRVLIGLGFLCLLLLMGCKKLKTKDPIVYNIFAHIPYDNTPVPGVAYRIVEYKHKNNTLGEEEATGWEISGVTGSDGRASGNFLGKLKTNYSYKIFFDYLGVVLPSGINEVEIKGPKYDQLTRSNPLDNDYEIRVLPYTTMHFKIENVNCFNTEDKMRYKVFNCDEQPHQDFQYIPWSHYFNGCGVMGDISSDQILTGHHLFQIEVTRNNEITSYVDTFFVQPGIVNNVFIEY